jgi:hypothetical protein
MRSCTEEATERTEATSGGDRGGKGREESWRKRPTNPEADSVAEDPVVGCAC